MQLGAFLNELQWTMESSWYTSPCKLFQTRNCNFWHKMQVFYKLQAPTTEISRCPIINTYTALSIS